MICAECGIEADVAAHGWRGYRLDDEGEEPEVGFFCPACAEREFGEKSDAARPPD